MIKVLFVYHGRTNDYCFVFELLEQIGPIKAFAVSRHFGRTTIDESKINKGSSLVVSFEPPLTMPF